MKPLEWILGADTGTSSKTIWAVMMYAVDIGSGIWPMYDIPHDPADFGRCYRLLELFPEWKTRLQEVADRFPKWGPLVREWDKLTKLYEEEYQSGSCPKLYDLMFSLRDECMEADGWVKDGSSSWRKKVYP